MSPGQIFMQVIELTAETTNYRLEKNVRENSEIVHIELLNDGSNGKIVSVVIVTDSMMSFWNLNKNEKFFSFDVR